MAASRKPNIIWMEGLLTHFDAPFPHKHDDPRRLGFDVGRQIIGLYIIEILLKYALDDSGATYGLNHNLHELFMKLSRQRRRAVERKYAAILNSGTEWAWDVAEAADSLLQYLGKDAITATRYFWEPDRTRVSEHASILIMPNTIRHLLYSLFIVLHGYPSKPIVKRYDTTFRSLADSLEHDQKRIESEVAER
jgi:hypothetical protein